MKKLIIFSNFLCVLLFSLSLAVFAQQKAKTEDGRTVILHEDGTWNYVSTTDSNQVSLLPIPEKRIFKHPPFKEKFGSPFRLEKKYDKFKNTTSISIDLKLTQISEDLSISSFFISDGKKIKTPDKVILMITSKSENWNYLNNSDLVFIVDDEIIDLGEMKRTGSVGKGYVLEFLSTTVSIETFLKIINGNKVEGRLFTTEFKLTDEQLEALRDYASRMKE
jgi:hypothetical protein